MYVHENRSLPEFAFAQQFANPFVMDWWKMQQLPYYPQPLPYYTQQYPWPQTQQYPWPHTQQYAWPQTQQNPWLQNQQYPWLQQTLPYFPQQLPQYVTPWPIQKPILPF